MIDWVEQVLALSYVVGDEGSADKLQASVAKPDVQSGGIIDTGHPPTVEGDKAAVIGMNPKTSHGLESKIPGTDSEAKAVVKPDVEPANTIGGERDYESDGTSSSDESVDLRASKKSRLT